MTEEEFYEYKKYQGRNVMINGLFFLLIPIIVISVLWFNWELVNLYKMERMNHIMIIFSMPGIFLLSWSAFMKVMNYSYWSYLAWFTLSLLFIVCMFILALLF